MSAKMAAETRRWTHPVVIGSGQRFVQVSGQANGLRLFDRHAFDAEIVVLSYPPVAEEMSPAAGAANTDLGLVMLGVAPRFAPIAAPSERCG